MQLIYQLKSQKVFLGLIRFIPNEIYLLLNITLQGGIACSVHADISVLCLFSPQRARVHSISSVLIQSWSSYALFSPHMAHMNV